LRAESEAGGGGGGGRHAALIKAGDLHLAAGMHIPGVVSGEIYFFTGDIPFIKWSYNMMNTVSPVKMMGPPSLRAPGSHLREPNQQGFQRSRAMGGETHFFHPSTDTKQEIAIMCESTCPVVMADAHV